MDLLRASLLLFTAHLRAIVLSKRALLCTAIALTPVAGAMLLAFLIQTEGEAVPAFEIGWMLTIQSVVPLIALILGSAVVAEEIEDRTVTYLFSRPIPRASVLLGRWLASLVLLLVLVVVSSEVTYLLLEQAATGDDEFRLPEGMAAEMRNVAILAAVVYSGLFSAAGALLKHPMIVGIGYTFAVEGFLANLPGKNQSLTIQYYLKSWLAGTGDEVRFRMRHLIEGQDLAPPGEALTTLLVTLGVALLLGAWTVSRKQYVLTS